MWCYGVTTKAYYVEKTTETFAGSYSGSLLACYNAVDELDQESDNEDEEKKKEGGEEVGASIAYEDVKRLLSKENVTEEEGLNSSSVIYEQVDSVERAAHVQVNYEEVTPSNGKAKKEEERQKAEQENDEDEDKDKEERKEEESDVKDNVRNWNEEFQQLMEQRHQEEDLKNEIKPGDTAAVEQTKLFNCNLGEEKQSQRVALRLRIGTLAKEFTDKATALGKIIIDERFIATNEGLNHGKGRKLRIPPIDSGGVAGGLKYFADGIFFKFAVDEHGIYAGDEWAMKAAGHELKGLSLYISLLEKAKIQGLSFPLMALINYRGFRLIASTVLPLGQNTIIYGSADGKRTVHADVPQVNDIMKEAAEEINIKGHWVTPVTDCSARRFLYACGDIEVHRGKDGRFYLLDTHRVMPPMIPDSRYKGTFLYRLFRPEFVKYYRPPDAKDKLPLCSDGFCAWGLPGSSSKDKAAFKLINDELREACRVLEQETLPALAAAINNDASSLWRKHGSNLRLLRDDCWDSKNNCFLDSQQDIKHLVVLLHREGLNVRYLGKLRELIREKKLRKLLLMEMIVRVSKNLLREHMRYAASPDPKVYHAVTSSFYNALFLSSSSSSSSSTSPSSSTTNKAEAKLELWTELLPKGIQRRFNVDISSDKSFLQPEKLDKRWMFNRLNEVSGIVWTKRSRKNFFQRQKKMTFLFEAEDVKELAVVVDRLHLVSFYDGYVLFQEGKKLLEAATPKETRRRKGMKKIAEACRCYLETMERRTGDVSSLNNWGIALNDSPLFTLALRKFEEAQQVIKQNPDLESELENVRYNYAICLFDRALCCPSLEEALALVIEAASIFDSLHEAQSTNPTKQKDANVIYNAALCYIEMAKLVRAEEQDSCFNNARKYHHMLKSESELARQIFLLLPKDKEQKNKEVISDDFWNEIHEYEQHRWREQEETIRPNMMYSHNYAKAKSAACVLF
ncbi:Histidine kinase A [Balamuthia mandrillaris]